MDQQPAAKTHNGSGSSLPREASPWKPASNQRRHSWSKEDHKRELHITAIEGVKTGPGFTEHK